MTCFLPKSKSLLLFLESFLFIFILFSESKGQVRTQPSFFVFADVLPPVYLGLVGNAGLGFERNRTQVQMGIVAGEGIGLAPSFQYILNNPAHRFRVSASGELMWMHIVSNLQPRSTAELIFIGAGLNSELQIGKRVGLTMKFYSGFYTFQDRDPVYRFHADNHQLSLGMKYQLKPASPGKLFPGNISAPGMFFHSGAVFSQQNYFPWISIPAGFTWFGKKIYASGEVFILTTVLTRLPGIKTVYPPLFSPNADIQFLRFSIEAGPAFCEKNLAVSPYLRASRQTIINNLADDLVYYYNTESENSAYEFGIGTSFAWFPAPRWMIQFKMDENITLYRDLGGSLNSRGRMNAGLRLGVKLFGPAPNGDDQ